MNVEERFVSATLASVTDIFNSMIPLELEMGEYQSRETPEEIPCDIIGIIGIAGNVTGTISLFLSRDLAMTIASLLLDETIEDMTEDVYESVGELTNMVAGGIKTALSTHWDLFDLSLPTVLSGSSPQTYHVNNPSYHWQIPIKTAQGTLVVSIAISNLSAQAAAQI